MKMLIYGCKLLLLAMLWELLLAASVSAQEPEIGEPRIADGRFGQAFDAGEGGWFAPARPELGQWPLTVEAWIQLTGGTGDRVLVANGLRTSSDYWELRVDSSGRLQVEIPGFMPGIISAPVKLSEKTWHYVAMVLEEDRVRLYVDGKMVQETELLWRDGPRHSGALAVGTRLAEKRPSSILVDDLRLSGVARDILLAPDQPFIRDRHTIDLYTFDESEAAYLARWTPGGETNQRELPYAHRIGEYEFAKDPQWVDGRWQDMEKGPFLTHSTQIPGYEVGVKNITLLLAGDGAGAVMFDSERCAAVAGFTAAFLRTDPARFGLLRKPQLEGQMQFYVPPAKAWRGGHINGASSLQALDRRSLDYQGLHLHGDDALLVYHVAGATVRDLSRLEQSQELAAIARTVETDSPLKDVVLTVAEMPMTPKSHDSQGIEAVYSEDGDTIRAIALHPSSNGVKLAIHENDVLLEFSPDQAVRAHWFCWTGDVARLPEFFELVRSAPAAPALEPLERPGPARWGEPLVTHGTLAADAGSEPYVIDTVTIPYDNPFRALFFVSGIDFFQNGDAAVCTAHGDVWRVGGLDATLNRITWQRFATGLYQPLGLKIVKDQVVVLGRDQLTRLYDENEDGEADYYESFNHDLQITGRDHAFALRLETDSEGNFYFLKSGDGPHGSALLRVERDGSELSVVAKGFRHPYGMGIGPGDQITVADNEGNYVPSSKIDLIEKDGFYGFLPGDSDPGGLQPVRPLCYLPKVADNSCGGQTWVTSDRWGDYHRGEMLHLSWGRCTLHAVLREQVEGVWQAATVQFPDVTFLSGPGEGVFHPLDGQLYVVGLNGWQTGAAADGSLQRVRYTGQPIHLPSALHVHADGLRLTFSRPLERAAAENIDSYRIEQWNYRWSKTYGSFHYSVSDPQRIGHDALEISQAELSDDGRTVFLHIAGLQPVDQLHVHVDVRSAGGKPLRFDIYGTVNAVAGKMPGERVTR